MDERRKNGRFGLSTDIIGEFELLNRNQTSPKRYEKFIVKDIGFGGANLVSNYLPDIGSEYNININRYGKDMSLQVKVVYSNIERFTTDCEGVLKPGIHYSIGCKLKNIDCNKRECIKYLIQNKRNQ